MDDVKYIVEVVEDDAETLLVEVYETRTAKALIEASSGSRSLIASGRFAALSDGMHFAGNELAAVMGDHWY